MKQYLELLEDALGGAKLEDDRTGLGTVGVFGRYKRWDLSEGFPAVTTKRLYWHGVKEELMWFLRGETNIRSLVQKNVHIWNQDAMRHNLDYILDSGLITEEEIESAREDSRERGIYGPARELQARFGERIQEDEEFAVNAGELGPVYGAQWRGTRGVLSEEQKQLLELFAGKANVEAAMQGKKPSVLSYEGAKFVQSVMRGPDQIARLEEMLHKQTHSRRKIVNAWNQNQVQDMALPACHKEFQVYINPETNELTVVWNQRSCDTVLGVPFNIASYGLLTHLIAHTHDFAVGELLGEFRNLHVYLPHIPAAKENLSRKPKPLPQIEITAKHDSITEYKASDFKLIGYDSHPSLEHETFMFGGLF